MVLLSGGFKAGRTANPKEFLKWFWGMSLSATRLYLEPYAVQYLDKCPEQEDRRNV